MNRIGYQDPGQCCTSSWLRSGAGCAQRAPMGELCASVETLDELAEVLERGKFDRYRSIELRREFAAAMRRAAHLFEVFRFDAAALIPARRDPKDDKFLALALAAEADVVVSSDEDLLVLNPWRGIPIVTPAEFVTILGR